MILFVTYLQTFAVSFTVVKAKEKLYISIYKLEDFFHVCILCIYGRWSLWCWCCSVPILMMRKWWVSSFSSSSLVSSIHRKLCDPSRVRPDYQKTRGPSFWCVYCYIPFIFSLCWSCYLPSHVLVIIFSKELLRLSYNAPTYSPIDLFLLLRRYIWTWAASPLPSGIHLNVMQRLDVDEGPADEQCRREQL